MTDVLSATSNTLKTLVDGSLRMTITIEPADRVAAMTLFGEPNTPMGIAALEQGAAQAEQQKKFTQQQKGPYGKEAQALHQSGFFRTPNVWLALGTDDEYQAWCRKQKCVVCGDKDFTDDYPEGVCEYAHVRRVANGSGTAIKPPYSGVPMDHECHSVQHNKGELASYVAAATYDKKITVYSEQNAKDWFDKKRIQHLEKWAHYQLCEMCGVQSLTEVAPHWLVSACVAKGISEYLPSIFKGNN